MQRAPIVILPANPVHSSQRPIHLITWQDLVNHRSSGVYVFRVCSKALQKFRIWDAEQEKFRTWGGPLEIRWFHTDYVHDFPLLRIYGIPEAEIRCTHQARDHPAHRQHSPRRKRGKGKSRMDLSANSTGNQHDSGYTKARGTPLHPDSGSQLLGRRK